MNRSKPIEPANGRPFLWKIVKWTWIVGTFDLISAIMLTLLNGNGTAKMLRYIASGIFGDMAFSEGTIFIFLGLLFHYLIAFFWTFLLLKTYPMIKRLMKHVALIGIMYGLFVWTIMNLLVLPLSHVPQGTFSPRSAIVGMLVLMSMIGLPLAFIADGYYGTTKPTEAE